MGKFFWLKWKRRGWEPTSKIRGLQGQLGFFGFSFHKGPGIYHNGKNWIIFSSFDKWGYTFYYKGDEVIWMWPWRKGKRYLNTSVGGGFNSLKEMDDFWSGHYQAMEDNEPKYNPS